MTTPFLNDRWSKADQAAGESYSKVVEGALALQLDHIMATANPPLSDDKRAVVEMVVLLGLAAQLGHERLRLTADDFAVTACEVYDQR
jgi:hypothetical protein